jgi:hypothetical protein
LSLLAGACGRAVDPEPPVDGPDDVCTFPTLTDAPAPASALTAFAYDREAGHSLGVTAVRARSFWLHEHLGMLAPDF